MKIKLILSLIFVVSNCLAQIGPIPYNKTANIKNDWDQYNLVGQVHKTYEIWRKGLSTQQSGDSIQNIDTLWSVFNYLEFSAQGNLLISNYRHDEISSKKESEIWSLFAYDNASDPVLRVVPDHEYTYAADGRMLTQTQWGHRGEFICPKNLFSEITYYYYKPSGTYSTVCTYLYDKQMHCTEMEKIGLRDDLKKKLPKEKYKNKVYTKKNYIGKEPLNITTYDKRGNPIKIKSIHKGTPSYVDEYEYDKQDRVVVHKRYHKDNKKEIDTDSIYYTSKGRIAQKTMQFSNGQICRSKWHYNQWGVRIDPNKFEYKYDEYGNWVQRTDKSNGEYIERRIKYYNEYK